MNKNKTNKYKQKHVPDKPKGTTNISTTKTMKSDEKKKQNKTRRNTKIK